MFSKALFVVLVLLGASISLAQDDSQDEALTKFIQKFIAEKQPDANLEHGDFYSSLNKKNERLNLVILLILTVFGAFWC